MEFRILVQSHDAQLFLLLQHVLATEGFAASLTLGTEKTLEEVADEDVRAVIVDRSASGADIRGLRILKAEQAGVAVVLLLNKTTSAIGFSFEDAGVDLVLGRPFNPALLIQFLRRLRLDALIEKGGARASDRVLRFADLEMNTATVKVRRNGGQVPLTALQFRLLRRLLQNPGTVQSREQLIAAAWPEQSEVEPRTVDIHIGHIRRALKKHGPDLIRTVRTLGYALDAGGDLETPNERRSDDS